MHQPPGNPTAPHLMRRLNERRHSPAGVGKALRMSASHVSYSAGTGANSVMRKLLITSRPRGLWFALSLPLLNFSTVASGTLPGAYTTTDGGNSGEWSTSARR